MVGSSTFQSRPDRKEQSFGAHQVILAEDSYLVREGVRRLLESEPAIDLVAVCEDYDSLLVAIASAEPDVLLTDIRMPPTCTDEGVRAADRLREVRPAAGVVLLSQYADPAYALAFLQHGTQGRAYLLKERLSDLDQLLARDPRRRRRRVGDRPQGGRDAGGRPLAGHAIPPLPPHPKGA